MLSSIEQSSSRCFRPSGKLSIVGGFQPRDLNRAASEVSVIGEQPADFRTVQYETSLFREAGEDCGMNTQSKNHTTEPEEIQEWLATWIAKNRELERRGGTKTAQLILVAMIVGGIAVAAAVIYWR
jgi:hypothetical protein